MKIKSYLRRFSSFNSCFSISKGFTLIELIIVIAVVGILATIVFVAINPLEIINSANLAKAKTFSARVEHLLSISQVGKWSFEDTSIFPIVKDISGYGNDGDISNSPTSVEGVMGKALRFNGTNQYFETGGTTSGLEFGTSQQFTVTGWINWDGNSPGSSEKYIWESRSNSVEACDGTHPWYIIVAEGTTSPIQLKASGGPNPPTVVSAPINKNTWYHFVGVFNKTGNKISLYVNGELKGSAAWNPSGTDIPGRKFIGRSCAGNYWPGLIDEVAIYSKALLSSQIQQLYVQGLGRHQLANR